MAVEMGTGLWKKEERGLSDNPISYNQPWGPDSVSESGPEPPPHDSGIVG